MSEDKSVLNDIFPPVPQASIDRIKRRHIKPKPYTDRLRSHHGKSGDVVYYPSHPNVKMTIVKIPHCNYTAGHDPTVVAAWFDTAGHRVESEFEARGLMYDGK